MPANYTRRCIGPSRTKKQYNKSTSNEQSHSKPRWHKEGLSCNKLQVGNRNTKNQEDEVAEITIWAAILYPLGTPPRYYQRPHSPPVVPPLALSTTKKYLIVDAPSKKKMPSKYEKFVRMIWSGCWKIPLLSSFHTPHRTTAAVKSHITLSCLLKEVSLQLDQSVTALSRTCWILIPNSPHTWTV